MLSLCLESNMNLFLVLYTKENGRRHAYYDADSDKEWLTLEDLQELKELEKMRPKLNGKRKHIPLVNSHNDLTRG